jgi:predicted phage terminase large subunit-like protein
MEPLRHVSNPNFGAVFFRRTTVQVRNEGGLWDESANLYPLIGGAPKEHVLEWAFPAGGTVSFNHLEHDKTVYNWQGSQIPLICFDELTHFSEKQFWYMVSRNRSMCGVKPYIRATCNPDADSWVATFISWWINQDTGLPILERAGKLRWFVRIGDTLIWADEPSELAEYIDPIGGKPIPPKSVTFVPAKLTDNLALMAADPGYLANLMAQPTVERERLLGGNWKIRPAAGLYFQRGWCTVVDAIPIGCETVRYWDLASTPKTENNDPDWTVGVKMARDFLGFSYICDVVRLRASPMDVERTILNTASADGRATRVGLPQDPGQAGKAQVAYLTRQLAGYTVSSERESGDKPTRFGPFSSQAQAGNIRILRQAYQEPFLTSLEGFPEAAHDDDADACSGAFDLLITPPEHTPGFA